ncbi:hypothetical protein BCR37DRAFT_398294 [Protomyces lactucae-debilis]|uniref:Pentacotripeptide-repeat region of PRORP domain-containing protein n=1 Tax=Protomyces lactucae-debilis TaxID=2754530 RepID=A0A1Y2FGV5_PROLT|nr:uncharacterized protein BCR37DRAFT_398294 [Protomyces lactucae-debilis]ORY83178.1 hypothetical protein BCR37DRAFT_398294 [Protomyces lactucae-debilis]
MSAAISRARVRPDRALHQHWVDDCVQHVRDTHSNNDTKHGNNTLTRIQAQSRHSPVKLNGRDRFEKAAKNMFKLNKAHKVYSLAAYFTFHEPATSALMWKCSLMHHMKHNDSLFKRNFISMLSSPHLVEPSYTDYVVWRHAIQLGLQDDGFMQKLYEACCTRQLSEGHWKEFYTTWLMGLMSTEADHALQVYLWHRKLQRDGLGTGSIDWRRLCYAMCTSHSPSKLIYGLHSLLRQAGASPHFYMPVMDYLVSQRRFEEAHQAHLYFFEHADLPDYSAHCDALLRFHLQHSTPDVVQAFIRQLETLPQPLAQSTQQLIAGFHAVSQDYGQLSTKTDEDNYWAAALLALADAGNPLDPVLRRMQKLGCSLGPASLQACLFAARDLEHAKKLITKMMVQGFRVTARGYAILVRFIAKHGDGQKALKIVRACVERDARLADVEAVSKADTDFLYRNLILGLLEGRHFHQLETMHHDLVNGGQATSDTWNLLLRSRIVNFHMDDALAGLEEMSIQNLVVENATAEEFSMSLLRVRRPGSLPDVMDMADRRPHLVDIRLAIQAVSKCLRTGGRVQPEAWREICKRLGMYGEFKTLGTVMDWLIYQYGQLQDPNRKRFMRPTRTTSQLSPTHKDALLQRLLTQRDVGATVTRGFLTGKPVEALELLLRWSQHTLVDPEVVQARISVGIRALARKPTCRS